MAEIENTDEFVVRMTLKELNTLTKEIFHLARLHKTASGINIGFSPERSVDDFESEADWHNQIPELIIFVELHDIVSGVINLSLEQEERIDNKQQEGET